MGGGWGFREAGEAQGMVPVPRGGRSFPAQGLGVFARNGGKHTQKRSEQ